ncbi:MAG: thiolase family protein [Planctomycetes bacterium]|nr:thiolase family protein [Planctomycetota bacterium]
MNTPVIVAARRTPIGKFLGSLARVPAPVLGSYAIKACLEDAPAAKDQVDACFMGNVLQAGLGQNPARQAALKAGIAHTVNAVTVNKVCGSGLEAVMQAANMIRLGEAHCVVAGGMENMDLAPHLAQVRAGIKYGAGTLVDHMQFDGLTCAFENWPMGNAAEHTAATCGVTRADQDAFSVESNRRAAEATKNGWFKAEMVALTPEQCMGKTGLDADEGFRGDSTVDGLAKLRPAFTKDGSVTAGNASQISDGAAAVIVMSEEKAKALGLKVLARITGYGTAGVAPKDLFIAPKVGMEQLLAKTGKKVSDIDLFEVNEAFAAQVLADAKPLGIPHEKLNICGGGIALGHPIGASGARVLVTLVHQLHRTGGKRGLCSLCLGGGNAVSMMVET